MDINLKKSKKIRAFCYRMITLAALILTITLAVIGREALVNSYQFGFHPNTFRGDIFYLGEFREYIRHMYSNAMVGMAGIGDDNGYPLTTSYAAQYSSEAWRKFQRMKDECGGDIIFYASWPSGTKKVIQKKSNVSYPLFSEYDGHLMLPEDIRLCCYWNGETQTSQFFDEEFTGSVAELAYSEPYYEMNYKPNKNMVTKVQLVLAVKKDCTGLVLSDMVEKAQKYGNLLILFCTSIVTLIVFGILSLFTRQAAREAREDYARMTVKIWLEAKVLLALCIFYLGYYFHLYRFGDSLTRRIEIYHLLWLYFPLGCFVYLFYTDIRQNRRKVFRNSLAAKGFCLVQELIRGKDWYRRAMWLCTVMLFGGIILSTAGISLLVVCNLGLFHASGPVRVIVNICAAVMLPAGVLLLYGFTRQRCFLKDTESVIDKLSEIKEGRGNVPLMLSEESLLVSAAQDLNELEKGIENAVEQQNRSNRMRVELITNVSHDLKTPLTSIINYADLLCEEELSETAAAYATALQGKAYRLKNMVQDVFDLSKATSGNLPVEKTTLDLVKLIQQTLADMDERIEESSLTFKLNIGAEPLLIEADGEKLYRVFQNLFVNALQYSLENSRVHIQLSQEDGYAVARVKNTSRMELDFDTTEIVERFVRADSSRTSEGSGLGLSIVQSFVEAGGGQFKVETDADMFTACVKFPLMQEEDLQNQN